MEWTVVIEEQGVAAVRTVIVTAISPYSASHRVNSVTSLNSKERILCIVPTTDPDLTQLLRYRQQPCYTFDGTGYPVSHIVRVTYGACSHWTLCGVHVNHSWGPFTEQPMSPVCLQCEEYLL